MPSRRRNMELHSVGTNQIIKYAQASNNCTIYENVEI